LFKNKNQPKKSSENVTSASRPAIDTATEELAISSIEGLHIYDESDNILNIDDDDPFINKNPVFVSQKPVQPQLLIFLLIIKIENSVNSFMKNIHDWNTVFTEVHKC
jgi:hypothetical protein